VHKLQVVIYKDLVNSMPLLRLNLPESVSSKGGGAVEGGGGGESSSLECCDEGMPDCMPENKGCRVLIMFVSDGISTITSVVDAGSIKELLLLLLILGLVSSVMSDTCVSDAEPVLIVELVLDFRTVSVVKALIVDSR